MARPVKDGLEYISIDVDIFDDPKLMFVSEKYAEKGELISIKLLLFIFKNGYYAEWNDDVAILFANRKFKNVSFDLVKDVVEELIRRKFFDEHMFNKYGILTSKGIQKRWMEIITRAKRKTEIEERFSLFAKIREETPPKREETPPKTELTPINTEETQGKREESTQSKVKESKVKESKSTTATEVDEILKPQPPPEIGFDVVRKVANEVWKDRTWIEALCMANGMRVENIKDWMAQFNLSVSQDVIDDFTQSRYKKIFPGWLRSKTGQKINKHVDSNKKEKELMKSIGL